MHNTYDARDMVREGSASSAAGAIRHEVLKDEVVFHRTVSSIHHLNMSRSGPSFDEPVRAPGYSGPHRSHELLAFGGGANVHAPVYGQRLLLSQTPAENVTLELQEKAAAEVQLETMIMAALVNETRFEGDISQESVSSAYHAAMYATVLDAMHRFASSGFDGFVGRSLMTPWAREQTLSAWYTGAEGLSNGWEPATLARVRNTSISAERWSSDSSVTSDVEQLLDASPELRAIVANGRPPQAPRVLALTSADRKHPLSDGQDDRPCIDGCEWGTCFNETCHCFLGYAGADCSVPAPATSDQRPARHPLIGINVGGIADWSAQLPYVDHMRSSRQWIAQCGMSNCPEWDNGRGMDLYPTNEVKSLGIDQALGTMLLRDLGGHYYAGRYVLLYHGDGIVTLSMDDVSD